MSKYGMTHLQNGANAKNFGVSRSKFSWTPPNGRQPTTSLTNPAPANANRYRIVRNGETPRKADEPKADNGPHVEKVVSVTVAPKRSTGTQQITVNPVPTPQRTASREVNTAKQGASPSSGANSVVDAAHAAKLVTRSSSSLIVNSAESTNLNEAGPNLKTSPTKNAVATVRTGDILQKPAVSSQVRLNGVVTKTRFSFVRRSATTPKASSRSAPTSPKRDCSNNSLVNSVQTTSMQSKEKINDAKKQVRADVRPIAAAHSSTRVNPPRSRSDTERKFVTKGAYKLIRRRRNLVLATPAAQRNRVASWFVKTKYKKLNVAPKAKRRRTLRNVPCSFFLRFGKCKSGAACPFLHTRAPVGRRKTLTCESFEKLGFCALGTRCSKRHTLHLDVASVFSSGQSQSSALSAKRHRISSDSEAESESCSGEEESMVSGSKAPVEAPAISVFLSLEK